MVNNSGIDFGSELGEMQLDAVVFIPEGEIGGELSGPLVAVIMVSCKQKHIVVIQISYKSRKSFRLISVTRFYRGACSRVGFWRLQALGRASA